jgi:hypothetical protein
MKKETSFEKELKKQLEKTDVIDMEKQLEAPIPETLSSEPTEDFIKKRQMQQEMRKQYFPIPEKDQVALYERIQKESGKPINMSLEKNITKIEDIIKQADPESLSDMAMVEKLQRSARKQSGLTRKNLPKSPSIIKKGGKFGLIASALGLGTSLLAPESKAAQIVSKIGEAAEKADPATYLQQGISDFDKKFKEMQDEANRKKLEKQLMEKEVEKVVEATGGEPDIRPSKADKLTGEKESPDIEDMTKIINYEDYLNQRKRKLGY